MYYNIKFSFSRLHQLDPTHECILNALKCTLPCLIGTFCWMYFRKPFSFFIILLPAFSIMVMSVFPTYKLKFSNLAVFLSSLAVLQFLAAVLHNHPFILVAFFFILIFPLIASIKYRYVSVFAILCAVIYLVLPGGWYAGTNRVIEIVLIGIGAAIFQLCIEYCTSKIRMRATILYLFDLIADAFYAFTAHEQDYVHIKIRNKYLFERPLSFKADFAIEKIYKSDSEKFIHRILMELINKGKFIEDEDFYFNKNIDYKNFLYPQLILCRRMFRNVTFMLRFHEHEIHIYALLPNTKDLIVHINRAFRDIMLGFRSDDNKIKVLEDKCVDDWLHEHDKLKNNKDIVIEKEVLEFIYGMKCMIYDIRKLVAIIN